MENTFFVWTLYHLFLYVQVSFNQKSSAPTHNTFKKDISCQVWCMRKQMWQISNSKPQNRWREISWSATNKFKTRYDFKWNVKCQQHQAITGENAKHLHLEISDHFKNATWLCIAQMMICIRQRKRVGY